jgi:enoyl-CoA hydratase/carnithine racemase
MQKNTIGYSTLLVEKREQIAIITLNRPEKLNAVSMEMRQEFLDVLKHLETDDEVKVVIVTGAGDSFCAGADISEFETGPESPKKQELANIVRYIYEFEKPIIGAINGVSAGAGSQWLLAFDLNIASEKAKLGWPATKLGIL